VSEAPLAALVSRALGAEVADVTSEPLGEGRERVRFRVAGEARTLVFERHADTAALEVQLLPFLARKSAHVPVVHARGIPPRTVTAPQWVLVEDLTAAPSACDTHPVSILEAKIAVEAATARDGPALRALGVPERPPERIAEAIADATSALPDAVAIAAEAREAARRLGKWPVALVHGELDCAAAVIAERGVVIRGWRRAHLGCALLDVVRLVTDVVGRGEAVLGIGLTRTYAERLGLVLPTEVLRGAEKLDALAVRYLERSHGGPARGTMA
jgi:hypothetical protein